MGHNLPKSICVVSGKGGVGKTTVTINLASAFGHFDQNTLVIDADMKMSGTSIHLGMYDYPLTLNDLLRGDMSTHDAIYHHQSGLNVIPSSFFDQYSSLFMLKDIVNKLKHNYDFIFIDSPPGVEEDTLNILKSCGGAIAVTTPDVTSLFGVLKVVKAARDIGVEPLGVIINKYNKKVKGRLTRKEVSESLDLPVLGVVPDDNAIRESVNRRLPSLALDKFSPSSIEFKNIVAKSLGVSYKPSVPLLRRIFRMLK